MPVGQVASRSASARTSCRRGVLTAVLVAGALLVCLLAATTALLTRRLSERFFRAAPVASSVVSRAKGAILYVTVPSAVDELKASLRALDLYYNDNFPTPVIIFHPAKARPGARDLSAAPLSTAVQATLRNNSRSVLIFAEVDFESLADAAALAAAPDLVYGFYTIGYRNMCNFFLQAVADEPALAGIDYYWRFDSHSNLVAPVAADVFETMRAAGASYGFASTQAEFWEFSVGLQAVAEHHFGRPAGAALRAAFVGPPLQWGANRNDAAIAACRQRADGCAQEWNGRIYFNNFEIVSLAWMRSGSHRAFAAALQAAGGIYDARRWGDAPMRTLAVEYLLSPREVHLYRYLRVEHRGGLHDTHAAAAEVLGEARVWPF